MTRIDRSSPLPLYSQLKAILLHKIEREWTPGELIPGESALEETYGLSRITVRQALGELVNEGYLYRQRGRGTFVTRIKFTHDPAQRLALTDTMRQQGVTPGWRVLDSGTCEATKETAERLGVEAGSSIFILKRLRLADEEAIGYHVATVPGRAGGAHRQGGPGQRRVALLPEKRPRHDGQQGAPHLGGQKRERRRR